MAFIIIVSIYAALVLVLAFGFARLEGVEKKPETLFFISVVIPFRNEKVLFDLSRIDYPADKCELIVVDDSDKPGHTPGKKAAITSGVSAAKGDIIATTDADCHVPSTWLREINKGFQNPVVKMLVGGVRIEENKSFFSRLQSLEFVSVAATGAATLSLGLPTMSNGANLSYRRNAFFDVNGYQGNEHIASGDDEFLMNKFSRKWKNSVTYLYSQDALVTTMPAATIGEFVSQRLRWAGKWRHNISLPTRVFAMVVWLFHLAFVILPFAAALGFITWKLFFILAGVKIFIESVFLIQAANFFRIRWRWFSFLALQCIYSFYVISTGLVSQIHLPEWKGRAVETKV